MQPSLSPSRKRGDEAQRPLSLWASFVVCDLWCFHATFGVEFPSEFLCEGVLPNNGNGSCIFLVIRLTNACAMTKYRPHGGLVAQLVEQKTFNLLVPGSSPGGLTTRTRFDFKGG